jgi:organic radical activating enzyme
VDPAFAHEWEGVRQAEELLASIDEALASLDYRPHIVVTGGEPLIHAADPVFYEVIRGLKARGLFVAFESNGTQEPDFERFPAYRECCYALSVKLSNSAEPRERRIRPAALKGIAREAREHFLKFALDRELIASGEAEAEIAEIRAILPGTEIYCMPVGESRIALARNARAVFEFCMERGYHYSDRLHIRIYDTQAGV